MTVSSSRLTGRLPVGALSLTILGLSLTVFGLSGACGGGPPANAPGSGGEAAQGSEEGNPGETSGGTPEATAGPDCSDGSCALCGDGICPEGFYCDEGAPGGAACQWLPDCANQASCSCVQAALGSECQCEVRDGHPFVNCS